MLKIRDKIEIAAGGGSYTNEDAQDAVGTILTDSSTIDFTYNDGVPSITASVIPNSIDADEINYDNSTSGLTATDVQAAIDELEASIPAAVIGLNGLYGDGSDGSATISSPTTTSLAYWHLYDDLTLTSTFDCASRPIFVYDTLDLSGAAAGSIQSNGTAASGGSAATAISSATRTTPVSSAGASGGSSSTTNGAAGAAATNVTFSLITPRSGIGNSGRGGNGGAAAPRTGGAGSTSGTVFAFSLQTAVPPDPTAPSAWGRISSTSATATQSISWAALSPGSGAGGGGAGNGTQPGTQGGGAGAGGGFIAVYAKRIRVGASTAASCIQALGGAGGNSTNASNANTAAGGGGGGGGGGLIIIVCDEIFSTDGTTSVSAAVNASSGAGGTAGTSNGTATDGGGGYSGGGGRILLWNRGAGKFYISGPTAANAPSGRTGGASASVTMDFIVE